MKTLNEMMMGEDYALKTKMFNAKMDEIIANYKGNFDKNNPMITMLPNKMNGQIKIVIDDNVPADLEVQILEAFNSVWK